MVITRVTAKTLQYNFVLYSRLYDLEYKFKVFARCLFFVHVFDITTKNRARIMPRMTTEFHLMTLGQRLRYFRKQAGLTQTQLGDLVGLSQQAVAYVEKDRTKMPHKIHEIASVLEISPALLAFGDERVEQLTPDVIEAAIHMQSLPEEDRQVLAKIITNYKPR